MAIRCCLILTADQAVQVPRRDVPVGLRQLQRAQATRKTSAQPRHQDAAGIQRLKHNGRGREDRRVSLDSTTDIIKTTFSASDENPEEYCSHFRIVFSNLNFDFAVFNFTHTVDLICLRTVLG